MAIQFKAIAEPGGYGAELRTGERSLASYAASGVPSRGRQYTEADCVTRSPFQRDRDRVLHSSAFRRMTYKTQVFLFHEGDHYRTRLTHSLEVAQIARTICRQLRLDEDLAEALALAHDLGHSPFGHAGERALDASMRDYGGFDHNAQSLRVVTKLERKYFAFDGLNLSWETLEGLAKHNGPVTGSVTGPVTGQSAVAKAMRGIEAWQSLEFERWPSAEAQVASLADDIAYLSHDVDDGLRAGLLTLDDLAHAPFAGAIAQTLPAADSARAYYEVTRRMITAMIASIVGETRARLSGLAPVSVEAIRQADAATAAFPDDVSAELRALKVFLFDRVYHHPRVLRVVTGAEQIVRDLFQRYYETAGADLPAAWAAMLPGLDERQRARLIADYLAGQTDRFAVSEHRRLFTATPDLL